MCVFTLAVWSLENIGIGPGTLYFSVYVNLAIQLQVHMYIISV
jgi:hypothetical protein